MEHPEQNTATPHERSCPGKPTMAPRTRASHVFPSRKKWSTRETNLVAFSREDDSRGAFAVRSCGILYVLDETQVGGCIYRMLTNRICNSVFIRSIIRCTPHSVFIILSSPSANWIRLRNGVVWVCVLVCVSVSVNIGRLLHKSHD